MASSAIVKKDLSYFVYILECADGSLYTGIATDVVRRFTEHARGAGSRYVFAHVPRKIVYHEKQPSRSHALKREAEIKRWSRAKKLELIVKPEERIAD